MPENHDKLYGILLDVQKQIGDVKTETGKQTATLKSLESKATYTNGKIAQAMRDISTIEVRLSDYEEVKAGAKDVITTKKAIIMLSGTVIAIAMVCWGIFKYAAKAYVLDILSDNKTEVHEGPWENE